MLESLGILFSRAVAPFGERQTKKLLCFKAQGV